MEWAQCFSLQAEYVTDADNLRWNNKGLGASFLLFNSFHYLFVFLPLVFMGYFAIAGHASFVSGKIFLVFASLFFYSWWDIAYLPLISGSLLFNYIAGNYLLHRKAGYRKVTFVAAVLLNLALLGYFKYVDFFIENLNLIFTLEISAFNLALPLAISFFTFQQIAYLADSYKGVVKTNNIVDYCLFVTFFPQLISGPIVHHKEIIPQFSNFLNARINTDNIATGIVLISIGLFKKMILADNLAVWSSHGFDTAQELTMIEAWATSYSFSLQIYYDFSAYMDMAAGSAMLFNISLPKNFDSPLKALTIKDFWRRWHITLTQFLFSYVAKPLLRKKFNTLVVLMITFLLSGLWHGAGWTFVFWGFVHGLALIVYGIWSKYGFRLNIIFAWLLTFNFLNFSAVFFRANDWPNAIKVLSGMVNIDNIGIFGSMLTFGAMESGVNGFFTLIFCLLSFALIFLRNSNQLAAKPLSANLVVFCALLFSVAVLSFNKVSPFLYFNF